MWAEQTRRLLLMQEQKEKLSSRNVLYLCGLAGSGKTAIAESLAYRNRVLKIVPEFLEPIPNFVMNTRPDSSVEQRIAAQSWILQQYEKKNEIVRTMSGDIVVDRTWLDCLTYSIVYGSEVINVIVDKIAETDWVPGEYVIVYASPDVVKDRLRNKFQLSEKHWYSSWSPYIESLHNVVLEILSQGYGIGIDTTHLSINEATQQIQQQLYK